MISAMFSRLVRPRSGTGVSIWDDARTVVMSPSGQQIGLMIFSSDRDFTLRPDPGTKLTIDLAATSIALPIVGGLKSLTSAMDN